MKMSMQQALAQERIILQEMSQSLDPAEQTVGKLKLALIPTFRDALIELCATQEPNDVMAASLQSLAEVLAIAVVFYCPKDHHALCAAALQTIEKAAHAHIVQFLSGGSMARYLSIGADGYLTEEDPPELQPYGGCA